MFNNLPDNKAVLIVKGHLNQQGEKIKKTVKIYKSDFKTNKQVKLCA